MPTFDYQYLETMRNALLAFHGDVGTFLTSQGEQPAAGSQAEKEHSTYARPESIVTAWSIGIQLIEFGGEHLTAFVKTVTNPAEVIACWTCVRSMLESCAISAWVLEPAIDAHTRVGRVFAYRHEGMEQQLTFGRVSNMALVELQAAEDRLNDVEQHALTLGFAPLRDGKGRRTGIAQKMPGATDLIKTVLDEEVTYRLLSAVAHGHSWAIIPLGFKQVANNVTFGSTVAKGFQKTDDVKGIAFLGIRTMKALGKPIWNQCRYFGWDLTRLEGILENIADSLQATPAVRFWRP